MNVKLEELDLEIISGNGYRCGCCHRPIKIASGVTFGRPRFIVPAINICQECITIAFTVLGTQPAAEKGGKTL